MAIELPSPVAFVLGGGGSLGAIQVGMLAALADAGVRPDLVIGTSVGSLNGAMVAHDPDGAVDRLLALWPRVTKETIFPGRPWTQLRTVRDAKTYLYSNDAFIDFLRAELPVSTIEELRLPYGAVACDVETGEPVVLRSGLLTTALLASAAIPGVFPSVWHNGRILYDGGLVANVPVREALDMGAASMVVLDCLFPGHSPTPPDTMGEVIALATMIASRRQAVSDLGYVTDRLPVVYLPGPDLRRLSPLDFTHTATLLEGARAASTAFLRDLVVDGPGLYGSVYAPR
jgi:NTE family protein